MRTLNIAAAVVGTVFVMLAGAACADDPKFASGKRDEIAKLPPLAAAGIVGYRFSPDERLVLG